MSKAKTTKYNSVGFVVGSALYRTTIRRILAPSFDYLRMTPKNYATSLLFFLLFSGSLAAQRAALELPVPKLEALRAQDRQFGNPRFSAPLPIDLAPASAPNEYTQEGGQHVWSQTFRLPGTHGLGVFLDRVNLPEGGLLELSNAVGTRGAFRQGDVSREQRLFTGFLPGDEVTLTYRGPLPSSVPFHIWRVDHVYRPDIWVPVRAKDFGDSDACQINANCPQGDGWDDVKSGTARINLVVEEGVGFCSGNLINNTAQDGRALVLTGFHCMDGFTPIYDLWSFDFGYLGADCNNPSLEPTPSSSYLGTRFLAGLQETDFMLLEIDDPNFIATDHYFAGWDRSDGDVSGVITHFHHPMGDIQKIGQSGTNGMDILGNQITWNSGVVTPPNHHFVMDYAVGSFQIGSSGSAYFDGNQRIRGQLNGGNPRCPGTSEAFVGRFHLSWNTGDTPESRLVDWLDPVGSNPTTLDGARLTTKRFVSGRVVQDGLAVAGATINFQWAPSGSASFTTNSSGFFRGERPAGVTGFTVAGTYAPSPELELGVDVGDIIAIRRHILGFDTLSASQLVAADVNNSGTVRVSDITLITRVILDVATWGSRPNWLVIPVGFPLEPIPTDIGAPIGISLNNPAIHDIGIDFFVLKNGDADGNAAESGQ
jgi:lysyl endopeptidase